MESTSPSPRFPIGRPMDQLDFHWMSTGLSPPICEDRTGEIVQFRSSWCPVQVRLVSSTTQSGVQWTESTYWTGLDTGHGTGRNPVDQLDLSPSDSTGLQSLGVFQTIFCTRKMRQIQGKYEIAGVIWI